MRKQPITLNEDEQTTALVTSNEPHSLLIMDKFKVLKVRMKKENPTPEDWIILRAMLCTLTSEEALEFQTKQKADYSFAVSQVINNNLNQPSSDESQVIVRNRSLLAELRDFENRKSGKRRVARKNLQSRLPYASYREQCKVLPIFLNGAQLDRTFAYKYLRANWDKQFRKLIQSNFEKYYEVECAKLILRYFPVEYVIHHKEKLIELCGYVSVRLRLPDDDAIDINRLKPVEYLYLMAKLKRSIEPFEAEDILYKHIITYFSTNNIIDIPVAPWSLLSIPDVSLMIWSLGHLGLFQSILQFDEINSRVIQWFESKGRNPELFQQDILFILLETYHYHFDKKVIIQRFMDTIPDLKNLLNKFELIET